MATVAEKVAGCFCCKMLPNYVQWTDSFGRPRVQRKAHSAQLLYRGPGWGLDTFSANFLFGRTEDHLFIMSGSPGPFGAQDDWRISKWRADTQVDSLIWEATPFLLSYFNGPPLPVCIDSDGIVGISRISKHHGNETVGQLFAYEIDADGSWAMSDRQLTSLQINGVEQFPLNVATQPFFYTRFSACSRHMAVQRQLNGLYRFEVGSYSLSSLSATECRLSLTTTHVSTGPPQGSIITLGAEGFFAELALAPGGTLYYYDWRNFLFDEDPFLVTTRPSGPPRCATVAKFPGFTGGGGSVSIPVLTGVVPQWFSYCYASTSTITFGCMTFDSNVPPEVIHKQFSMTSAQRGSILPGASNVTLREIIPPKTCSGSWGLDFRPTHAELVAIIGGTNLQESDEEADGRISLDRYYFGKSFSSARKRNTWNYGPGSHSTFKPDSLTAVSTLRFVVFTEGSAASENDVFLNLLFTTELSTQVEEDAEPLLGSVAAFELVFGAKMVEMTHGAITVFASGTVTYLPIEATDVTQISDSFLGTTRYRVQIRGVSGGESGGNLTISLRADTPLRGDPAFPQMANTPPRIPPIFTQVYAVPATP